jgi:predicted ATPase
MLKRLYVDNYNCLVNFEVSFGELRLLLGPNGAGKSSVLNVMFALRQILSGSAMLTDPEVFPARTLTRWQTRRVQTFEFDVELQGDPLRYRLEVEHDPEARRARILREELTSDGKPLFSFIRGDVQLYRDDHSPGPQFPADWSMSDLARVPPGKDNKKLSRFLDFVRKVMVCDLYPRSLVTESRTEDAVLARDGANFSAWYRHVLQERQDLVPAYLQALSEVIEGFKGIRLEKVGLDARAFVVIFEDQSGRYELKLDEISDGERALVALYAILRLATGQASAIFLDEPDNYVALPELQPWLIALKDACGASVAQAILSSHHPELIDYLGVDAGVWLKRDNGGPTQLVSLSAPPEGSLKLSELIARGWQP